MQYILVYDILYNIEMHSVLKKTIKIIALIRLRCMCEKDNLWVDHVSEQFRPRLLNKYSIKPSNERLRMMGFFNNISNNFG